MNPNQQVVAALVARLNKIAEKQDKVEEIGQQAKKNQAEVRDELKSLRTEAYESRAEASGLKAFLAQWCLDNEAWRPEFDKIWAEGKARFEAWFREAERVREQLALEDRAQADLIEGFIYVVPIVGPTLAKIWRRTWAKVLGPYSYTWLRTGLSLALSLVAYRMVAAGTGWRSAFVEDLVDSYSERARERLGMRVSWRRRASNLTQGVWLSQVSPLLASAWNLALWYLAVRLALWLIPGLLGALSGAKDKLREAAGKEESIQTGKRPEAEAPKEPKLIAASLVRATSAPSPAAKGKAKVKAKKGSAAKPSKA